MTERADVSTVLRLAIAFTAGGVLFALGLLVRETPYTLAAFMFLGQPLFAAGFLLFAWQVIRDLRRTGVL